MILIGLAILILRIGQDTLFLAKVDAFNRNNNYYIMAINFVEAIYGITVIKIILDLMQQNLIYVVIFGFGSLFGGLLSEGQEKGYVRRDLHLPFVAAVMAAAIREILNPMAVSHFPISLVDAFETLRTIFMGGIFTDLGRQKFINNIGSYSDQPGI